MRARVTIGFALFISALMLLVCAAFFAYVRHLNHETTDATLHQEELEFKSELVDENSTVSSPTELVAAEEPDLRTHNLAMLVIDSHGKIKAKSPGPAPDWPLRGDAWRVTTFQYQQYTVVFAAPWAKVENELRERVLLLLALSTLVVLAAAIGAWIMVGRVLSPIDRLAQQTQTASIENLRVHLDAPSRDAEITRLVATLNDLLERLGETAAQRGRFYAAAAHELRTPLQALTGHLEVAMSRPREVADYAEVLHETHLQAERLTTLVQDLLMLNQLEMDASQLQPEPLDLADICEHQAAQFSALANLRDINVELALPDTYEMNAPYNHAVILVRNLIENAIKYVTAGGKVIVSLSGSTLQVWNDCTPVEDWNSDKLFEPFFRPDESRNSQTGGNGLGLAICKTVCDVNHWQITLQQEPGGIRAVVEFGE